MAPVAAECEVRKSNSNNVGLRLGVSLKLAATPSALLSDVAAHVPAPPNQRCSDDEQSCTSTDQEDGRRNRTELVDRGATTRTVLPMASGMCTGECNKGMCDDTL